ncbi:MAG TPA: tripartite tricarboxylate transporter substrate binding protein [Burkholderiales bacterium]|nr:tripartite tricarboxylate transporter substrate binding protein [Burkholderiales bacterium]
MLSLRGACAVLLIAFAAQGAAQHYPSRPIRLIVPIAPGGGPDTISRAVAQQLTDQLGQTVVADNRPGASGAIALDLARVAAPDGYTLVTISASQVIRPLVYKASYDLARDFAPISQLSAQSYVLMVSPALPVKSVRELVAHAKSNPGRLNYASVGQGSQIHLMTELFRSLTGINVIHVPYKGIGAAYPDLMAGTTHFVFGGILSALAQIKAGRLRPLAVSGVKRMDALPDLPTVAEAGVPGFAVSQWYAMLAPAGTPPRVIDQLNRQIRKALQDREVSRRIAAEGSEAVGTTPQQIAAHIGAERDKWSRVIREAGIKGE